MSAPDIEVSKSDNYSEIFCNRIIGGIRNGYFEYEIVTETSDFKEAMKDPNFNFNKTVLKRMLQAKIIMPPSTLRQTIELLQKHLVDYETIFGKIPTDKEIQDRSRPSDFK